MAGGQPLGTGFFITQEFVLTCAHVLLDRSGSQLAAEQVFVEMAEDTQLGVREVRFGDGATGDIALLRVANPPQTEPHILPWERRIPRQGEQVWLGGFRQSGTAGRAAEFFPTVAGLWEPVRRMVMLRDEAAKGFSGGPVLTLGENGPWLVGMTTTRLREGPARTWVQPCQLLLSQLSALSPSSIVIPVTRHSATLEEEELELLRERMNISLHYIDIQVRLHDQRHAGELSGVRYLLERLTSSPPTRTYVFGHYGCGKSSLAVETSWRMLSSDLKIQPYLVQLRDFDGVPTWSQIRGHITSGMLQDEMRRFKERVASRTAVFLLDGLDEVAQALDGENGLSALQAIHMAVPSECSYVVFSRLSFFSDEERLWEAMTAVEDVRLPEYLSGYLRTNDQTAVIVQPPTAEQIEEYLSSVAASDQVQEALAIVREVYDLRDLAKRPVLLHMIAECLPQLIEKKRSGQQGDILPADLYLLYTSRWLNRSDKRATDRQGARRRSIMQGLALTIWEGGSRSVSVADVRGLIRSEFPGWRPHEVQVLEYQVANCSFLDLTARGYEFSHKSFLEFFVAQSLTEYLLGSARHADLVRRVLDLRRSHNEVLDFVRDMILGRLLYQRDDGDVDSLVAWLTSPVAEERAHVGHLLGHTASRLQDDALREALCRAYADEESPWVKRSLALANGRAGNLEVFGEWASALLPRAPHRMINLRYHIEYYGGVVSAVVAVLGHLVRSTSYTLRPMDLLTLGQFVACEAPLTVAWSWGAEYLRTALELPEGGSVDNLDFTRLDVATIAKDLAQMELERSRNESSGF